MLRKFLNLGCFAFGLLFFDININAMEYANEDKQLLHKGANIPTYVFGSDQNYAIPTLNAIKSLITHALPNDEIRIVLLATEDFWEHPSYCTSMSALSDNNPNVEIVIWRTEKLLESLTDEQFELYENIYAKFESPWKYYEIASIKLLFPILFEHDNLVKARYSSSDSCEIFEHFIWLDSDVTVLQSLSDFYQHLVTDEHEKQPIISAKFYQNCWTPLIQDITLDVEKNQEVLCDVSSGVLFFNLKYLRDINAKSFLFEVLQNCDKWYSTGKFTDREFFSELLTECLKIKNSKQVFYFTCQYNCLPIMFDFVGFLCNFERFIDVSLRDEKEFLYFLRIFENFMKRSMEKKLGFIDSLHAFNKGLSQHGSATAKEIHKALLSVIRSWPGEKDRDKIVASMVNIARLVAQDFINQPYPYAELISLYNSTALPTDISQNIKPSYNDFSSLSSYNCDIELVSQRCISDAVHFVSDSSLMQQFSEINPKILHWNRMTKPWITALRKLLLNKMEVSIESLERVRNILSFSDKIWLDHLIELMKKNPKTQDLIISWLNDFLY